jgi:oxalyl-CoA decarboxylase
MNFHASALNVVRDIVKANPDAILVVNEGAGSLISRAASWTYAKPRKRLDVGTWGVMGIGMGFSVAGGRGRRRAGNRGRGRQRVPVSPAWNARTICRHDLPVCVVILNNNGVYRGDEVNTAGGRDPSPLVFVKARATKTDGGLRWRGCAGRDARPSFATRWNKRSARASLR